VAVQKKTRTRAPGKTAPASAHGGRKEKSAGGSGKPRVSWAVLFWLAFAIFIFGLFLFNREAIGNSIRIVQDGFASRDVPALPPPGSVADPPEQAAPLPPPALLPPETQSPVVVQPPPEVTPPPDITERPPAQQQVPEPVQTPPVELRERALYFTQVDRGGSILRIRVERNLPLSSSPMTDVVQALIAGPTTEERQRGLISLIPPGTKMISAAVRDNTAYLNFSEDFRYNTYGVEGYAAQLRQIVFTVTEFPNVRDVQILIEGRRIDFLGEGIWIGSPLNRGSL